MAEMSSGSLTDRRIMCRRIDLGLSECSRMRIPFPLLGHPDDAVGSVALFPVRVTTGGCNPAIRVGIHGQVVGRFPKSVSGDLWIRPAKLPIRPLPKTPTLSGPFKHWLWPKLGHHFVSVTFCFQVSLVFGLKLLYWGL